VVAITWITDLYIRTITKTTAIDTVLDTLEIAMGTRSYVQQLMKMITFAYEIGIDEQQLTAWCTLFRMRYDLQSSIDIGGIVAAALAIDGGKLANDIDRLGLMQKSGLIALINSQDWNHQAVLDILDTVCTPINCFFVFFLYLIRSFWITVFHTVGLMPACISYKQCSFYPKSSMVIPHAMCLKACNYLLQGQLQEAVLVMSIRVIISNSRAITYLQTI
jgi:hypothetical protein